MFKNLIFFYIISVYPIILTENDILSTEKRPQLILQYLALKGAATYSELAAELKVSNMTVRRAVEQLTTTGKAIKTLGGVLKVDAPDGFYESSHEWRSSVNLEEKRSIAHRAYDLLSPRKNIYLDGSSTSVELAKCIGKGEKKLTIVSNSLLICFEAGRHRANTVIGLGGEYDPQSFCFSGPRVEDKIGTMRLDVACLSTKAVRPEEGTFESNIGLLRIKQIVANNSAKIVLMADHTKFGDSSLCKVLDMTQINVLVTDIVDSQSAQKLENAGVQVYVAPTQLCSMEA